MNKAKNADQILKKLILLDGMALTYRAHFALIRSPRFTSGGMCTSAIFGVMNTLQDIIRRENPTHLAVAFDTSDPTERHELYPEYKAQRDEIPEDITSQLPYLDRLFDACNIRSIRIPGYEADDIIGTLAYQATELGFQTMMVTPDKDFDQLVTENVLVMKPGRKGSEVEILGIPEVLEKWQVKSVDQVIDVLALMGDSSDNIPGIPGIGPKTAQKLIAQYGSVESLLEHSDELKGKQKERVQENVEQALLSKKLVTIQLDVPHDIDIESLAWESYDSEKLKELLAELEFETLGKRLFGSSFSTSENRAKSVRREREKEIQASLFDDLSDSQDIETTDHEYHVLLTADERGALLDKLKRAKEFSFNTRATGLIPNTDLPRGMAFSAQKGEAFFVVLPSNAEQARAVIAEFQPLFNSQKIAKVGHHLKYDVSLLKRCGIDVLGALMDTQLAQTMKEPEMDRGLDYLASLYLNYTLTKKPEINEQDIEHSPQKVLDQVGNYAAERADITLQIANVLRPDIDKQGVSRVCYEVECPLIAVLVDMEHEGIRLDTQSLAIYGKRLQREIDELRSNIYEAAGEEFNIDSPKQLGVILYEKLKIEDKPKKTATGQYSTREAELERLANRHHIVGDILDYRNAVKLKSVYVDQLPHTVNPNTGRVHTEYSQTWTSTGRIQSNNPNLQTIPIRKQRGREIRAAFVPRDENYLILSADYSQIELRVMADLSADPSLVKAFLEDADIHTITASNVYKVSVDEVTREMRDKAKTVNFGIIYGISAFGLQQRLNIPRAEAKSLIDNYFEQYPGVREYIDRSIAFARENGFTQTSTGRRRYLRDINSKSRTVAAASERLAMNSPIQGTAADILKLAMIRVHETLRDSQFKTKMLLTVHDELVFDLHRDEVEVAVPAIRDAMMDAFEMSVPLKVETGVGQNWLEAH